MSSTRPRVADAVMILVNVIWGLVPVVLKHSLPGWVTPGAFQTLCFALGSSVLCALVLAKEGSLRLPRAILFKVVLLGLLGYAFNQLLLIYGLANSKASNAGVWFALLPIFVALLSAAWGFERITPRIWMGAVLSTVGVFIVLIVRGGGLPISVGDLLLAATMLTWAVYSVLIQRVVQQASPMRVTAVAMGSSALAMLVFNIPTFLAQDFAVVPSVSWLGILYVAGLGVAAGDSLYIWSIRSIGATRVALYSNLSPFVTAAGAWLVLHEAWTLSQGLGLLLVTGGVVLARWDDMRPATATG